MEKEDKTYITNNLYLSCFILCKKYPLIDIEKGGGGKSNFVFLNDGTLEGIVKDYDFALENSPEVMVDVRSFVSAIKQMKEKLYGNNR